MFSQYRRDLFVVARKRSSEAEPLPVGIAPQDYRRGMVRQELYAGERPSEWLHDWDYGAAPMHGEARSELSALEQRTEKRADEWHTQRQALVVIAKQLSELDAQRHDVIVTRKGSGAGEGAVNRALAESAAQVLRRALGSASAATLTSMEGVLSAVQQLQSAQTLLLDDLRTQIALIGTSVAHYMYTAAVRRLVVAPVTLAMAGAWREFLDEALHATATEVLVRHLAAQQLQPLAARTYAAQMSDALAKLWSTCAEAFEAHCGRITSVDEQMALRACALQTSDVASAVQQSFLLFARAVTQQHVHDAADSSAAVRRWLDAAAAATDSVAARRLLAASLPGFSARSTGEKLTLENVDALLLRSRLHNWMPEGDTNMAGTLYTQLYNQRGAAVVVASANSLDDDNDEQPEADDESAAELRQQFDALDYNDDDDGDDDDASSQRLFGTLEGPSLFRLQAERTL